MGLSLISVDFNPVLQEEALSLIDQVALVWPQLVAIGGGGLALWGRLFAKKPILQPKQS